MKLFARYNRINLTVMILVFLMSGISYYFLITYVLIHELDETLDHYKSRIEDYVRKNNTLPPLEQLDETYVNYSFTDKYKKEDEIETIKIRKKKKGKLHNYRQLTYFQKLNDKNYEVTISRPIEGTEMLTKTIGFTTIAMLLTVIATSVLLNLFILRRLWQPFYHSLAAIKNFKLGKKRLPEFANTKIEEFSYMNSLLEGTIRDAEADYQLLKEFTENASHEIQTPLAIIRSKLDLVIQEGLSAKQNEAIQSIYAGIKRLSKLNQSLLLLAKIENQQFKHTSHINLKEKIEEKLTQFQEFWLSNEIKISADLQEATIESNPEIIDILLSNLFSNAGRHNVEGGNVFVRLRAHELEIGNTGAAKPLEAKRLFQRFYKEVQHSHHNGLGLSIVKQICEQAGIEINYSFNDSVHTFLLKWN